MKLYADEADHDVVRGLDGLAISALARVEVAGAFWRKSRLGELEPAEAAVLARAFEADFHGMEDQAPRFSVVSADRAVLDEAARLMAVLALHAYDAVQLASALAVRRTDPGCETFACFDQGLRAAAATSNFRLVP